LGTIEDATGYDDLLPSASGVDVLGTPVMVLSLELHHNWLESI
jgi:hypothetical protein